jgi:hypothetical protein
MARLDSGLWAPSALGLVGPRGAATAVALGVEKATYYTPYYDWMRTPAAIPDALRARCELVTGKKKISRVLGDRLRERSAKPLRIAMKTSMELRGCVLHSANGRHLHSASVVGERRDGSNVAIAIYHWVSPAISLSTDPADVFGRLAMGAVLAEDLVQAGFVGMVAPVPDARVRRRFESLLSSVNTLKKELKQAEAHK